MNQNVNLVQKDTYSSARTAATLIDCAICVTFARPSGIPWLPEVLKVGEVEPVALGDEFAGASREAFIIRDIGTNQDQV